MEIASAKTDYQVSFLVIRESSITNFYPYPNPFTSKCRFVFTLTGDQLPDQLLIRIMTISGKIVREITLAELGPIHIGNNISEFAWNGTDQFGDALGNGVYLYRVIARSKGEDIKHRETTADHTVHKGWGKALSHALMQVLQVSYGNDHHGAAMAARTLHIGLLQQQVNSVMVTAHNRVQTPHTVGYPGPMRLRSLC